MSERLRIELEESKAEIARLRNRLSIGMPPIHKDLSLISLIPKRSGAETATSLEEFLSSIEGAAKMGRWSQEDCTVSDPTSTRPGEGILQREPRPTRGGCNMGRFQGGIPRKV